MQLERSELTTPLEPTHLIRLTLHTTITGITHPNMQPSCSWSSCPVGNVGARRLKIKKKMISLVLLYWFCYFIFVSHVYMWVQQCHRSSMLLSVSECSYNSKKILRRLSGVKCSTTAGGVHPFWKCMRSIKIKAVHQITRDQKGFWWNKSPSDLIPRQLT